MRIVCRSGPPRDNPEDRAVVVELWMSPEEAQALALPLRGLGLDPIKATINEHLGNGRKARACRDVK